MLHQKNSIKLSESGKDKIDYKYAQNWKKQIT